MTAVPIDLSPNHIRIARRARDTAADDPSQALVGVVFAAAAFEAYLASVVVWATRRADHDPGPIAAGVTALATVLPQLERDNAQWALKLQAISVFLCGRAITKGMQPFQDLDLLFRIRNSIVHSKLTWSLTPVDDPDGEPHKLIRELVSRGLITEPRPIPGLPGSEHDGQLLIGTVIDALLRPEIAAWAVDTVEAGMRAVADMPSEAVFSKQIHHLLDLLVFNRHAG